MNNMLKLLAILLTALSLTSCLARETVQLPIADDYDVISEATPSHTLRVGLVPGLYSDMFVHAIQPLLENKGYTVEIVNYDDSSSPNAALAQNQIDLNMYQNYKSLNNYKFENDVALSAIAEVPTASMGIYSPVYNSLREIENGAKVAMPLENAELARALTVLENAGIISLDPMKDKSTVSWGDIAVNNYNLNFNPFRSQNLAKAFLSTKLLVIDSGDAAISDMEFPDAIYEDTGEDSLTVIAVRTENLHAQFVSDIISIVQSDEYKAIIANEGGEFAGYRRPHSFYADID